MRTETIISAIRCRLNETQTIVHTNKGQWLRVEGYGVAYGKRRDIRPYNAPLLSECHIIGVTDEHEFDRNCTQ